MVSFEYKVSTNNIPEAFVVQDLVGHVDRVEVVGRLQGVEFSMNVVEGVGQQVLRLAQHRPLSRLDQLRPSQVDPLVCRRQAAEQQRESQLVSHLEPENTQRVVGVKTFLTKL